MTRPAQVTIGLMATFALLTGIGSLHSQNLSREEVARLQYENGRGHMRRGNYAEGLKDFTTVADSYPESTLADNARLEISKYYFEIADDPARALKEADEILKRYPTSDSAPYAYLVQGEVAMERTRRKEDLEKAVATFDRVPGIYKDVEAVPRANYLAAEALRLAQRPAEALARYRRIVAGYPSDPVIPKAHIGTGMVLAQIGDAVGAMEEFQFARDKESLPEDTDVALGRLTVLYRLYVRPPQISAFTYSAKDGAVSGRTNDVQSIVFTPRGEGYFTTKSAIMPLAARSEPPPATLKPRALAVDRRGRLVAIDAGVLKQRDRASLTLSVLQNGANKVLDEVVTAASFKNGDWLVASDDDRGIQRFGPNGKHMGVFSTARTSRLAINEFDEVAALDRDAKTVRIFDEAGKAVGTIPQRGTGYELKNPVDIAFDALGHLYVLERTAVLVFVPRKQPSAFVRAFTEPETSPGALRKATAFAFDSQGRMYIADDNAEKIRMYQ